MEAVKLTPAEERARARREKLLARGADRMNLVKGLPTSSPLTESRPSEVEKSAVEVDSHAPSTSSSKEEVKKEITEESSPAEQLKFDSVSEKTEEASKETVESHVDEVKKSSSSTPETPKKVEEEKNKEEAPVRHETPVSVEKKIASTPLKSSITTPAAPSFSIKPTPKSHEKSSHLRQMLEQQKKVARSKTVEKWGMLFIIVFLALYFSAALRACGIPSEGSSSTLASMEDKIGVDLLTDDLTSGDVGSPESDLLHSSRIPDGPWASFACNSNSHPFPIVFSTLFLARITFSLGITYFLESKAPTDAPSGVESLIPAIAGGNQGSSLISTAMKYGPKALKIFQAFSAVFRDISTFVFIYVISSVVLQYV